MVLGRGGTNDEINILNVVCLLEHPKSWGWPASSRLRGDVGLHPSPPAIPPLPFPALGETAAPAAIGCSPHPICGGAVAPRHQTRRGAAPPSSSRCSPPSPRCRQDEAGDRHVPASAGSFIGTSQPSRARSRRRSRRCALLSCRGAGGRHLHRRAADAHHGPRSHRAGGER